MPTSEVYRRQAALLIRVIPLVAEETCFALKGGTAINLFVRDMPRLSVDVDLTYLPIADRSTSLAEINAALRRMAIRIRLGIRGANVTEGKLIADDVTTKLYVEAGGARIKIEVTPVLRGCVFEPVIMSVSPAVEEEFGFAEVQIVSFADLYAGKLVAALDRQHPRDLFDARLLLANEGITDDIRSAFVIYAVSHNRPLAEILAPTRLNIEQEFSRGFQGMTEIPVTLDELQDTREQLVDALVGKMPLEHRRFLVSIKAGDPDWKLLGVPQGERLPAVQWRLFNLAKMDSGKREDLMNKLRKALNLEEEPESQTD